MKKKSEKESAREAFTEYLGKKRLRKTPERFALLDKIYSKKGYFDADSLYEEMRDTEYKISRATVYNILKLFLDCQLVVRHQFGNEVRYERCLKKTSHHYLICTECGSVSPFPDENVKRMIEYKKIRRFKQEYYSLCIYGICSLCDKKKNNKKKT